MLFICWYFAAVIVKLKVLNADTKVLRRGSAFIVCSVCSLHAADEHVGGRYLTEYVPYSNYIHFNHRP